MRPERHEPTINEIRQRVADFWRWNIETRRPPQPTNAADVAKLYERDTGRAVEATRDIRESLEGLLEARNAMRLYEARKDVHEYAIKAFMRDATTLLVDGRPALTWKARADGVRVFRIR